jgi:3-phenylpropionate/trans-cinnamate dioxygenase ferredoxin reductase component
MQSATDTNRIVVIGAGQAASEFTSALRAGGHSAPVLMLGDEAYLPYQRPPLSKAFLAGEANAGALEIRSAIAYEKMGVEVRTGARVAAIDRRARRVELEHGGFERYGKLVLATGGRARNLSVAGLPGARRPRNLHYLRSIADAGSMREMLRPGLRLTIIGGGYVGLEVASAARKRGLEVTVLEALPRLLARVTAAELSAFYAQLHRDAGVDIRTHASVRRIETDPTGDTVVAVHTEDEVIAADLVLAGIGQTPNWSSRSAAGWRSMTGSWSMSIRVAPIPMSSRSGTAVVRSGPCCGSDALRLSPSLRRCTLVLVGPI